MGCVNKSSSEFKQLAAKHNVDSNTLEHITHKYWLETKNETLFPTDVYIQKQLGYDEYLEKGRAVRDLWKLRYSSPQEFSSMSSLQEAYKKASKFFPQSAITYYKNAKNGYTLSVSKPVNSLNHSKNRFFKDYDSMKSSHALSLFIEENHPYGIDKVQELFNRFNTDRTSRDLADRVFSLAKDLNLSVRFSDNNISGSKLGTYSNADGILYNKSFMENPSMDGKKANVLLHEAIHAITMYALSNQIDAEKLSKPLQQFKEEVNALFNEVKDNSILRGERGIVDAKEFVAELGNPVFRSKLQEIDRADKQSKSLWQRVLDAFKHLFNLHVTNSYYQRSMNALDKAISAFDVDLYMRYTGIKNSVRENVYNVESDTQYNQSLSVIDNAAKSGNWTTAALKELDNIINDIENGRIYYQRFPKGASRAYNQGGRANEAASLLLRASESTSAKNPRSFSEKYAEEKRQQPIQERIIEDWAKATGIWHGNLNAVKGKGLLAEGGEAQVFYDGKEENVTKILSTNYFITPQLALDRITIHNALFPEAPLKVTGFGRDSKGDFKFLVEQPFIQGEPATQREIDDFISKAGFSKYTKDKGHTFLSDDLYLSDLHDENAIKTPQGNIVVIDADLRLNTPELGLNGKYEISNEIVSANDMDAKDFLKFLSPRQLKEENGLIKQEFADYDLVNNIEQKPQRAERTGPQDFTFDDGTVVRAPFKPNEQQAAALNAMADFIDSNETTMTLSGYAGTGKTSIMEMIAQKARKDGNYVLFCASTNKAAAVLDSKVSKNNFKAVTLNKLFGINVEVDSNQSSYDARKMVNVLKENDITPGTTVIIDEASMINEENYNIINDIARENHLKIIYVGDSAQLAPVNEDKVSKVFRNGDGKVITLTQVERTDDNAILKEATDIRNGRPLSGVSSFNAKGEGVAYVSPKNKEAISSIIKHYVEGMRNDPNFFRILAYTNKAVSKYNEQARQYLGYNSSVPQVGEPMVGYNNWGYEYYTKSYRFVNSESYKVTEIGSPTRVSILSNNRHVLYMEALPLTLIDSLGHRGTFNYMDIKNNPQNKAVASSLAEEKAELWKLYHRAVGKSAKKNILSKINEIDKFLFVNDNVFASDNSNRLLQKKVIDFGYALTVHKSQGSTFTNVLLDDVDIASATWQDSGKDLSWDSIDLGEEESNTHPQMKELESSVDVDLGDLSDVNIEPSKNLSDDSPLSTRQQLEYVGVSRATDTVTVISNNIKKEDSPLNHPASVQNENNESNNKINPTDYRSSIEVTTQLVNHLKDMGITVLGRDAMQEFLKTHNLQYLQQMVSNYYMTVGNPEEIETLRHNLFDRFKNKSSFGCVGRTAYFWYLCDYFGDSTYRVRAQISIEGNEKLLNDFEKAIKNESFRSTEDFSRRFEAFKSSQGEHYHGGADAKIRISTNDNAGVVASKLQDAQISNKGRSDGQGSIYNAESKIDFFLTPQGEVYGFVDKDGNIYLDEEKISPEHPIHEYTHLWDRVVQQRNPELWQRGVALMKGTPLWNEVLNNENYGKKWQAITGMTQEKLDSLIASEVHSMLTGKQGASILEDIAKEKGKQGIIGKLKQWLLDFWRNLKETFSPWSKDELNNLTYEDFTSMTLRDFTNGVNPLKVKNNETNNNLINNGTEKYKSTDEFRRVQETVRGSGKKESKGHSVFEGYLKPDQRQRLADVLGGQLGSINSFIHGSSRNVDNTKHGTTFKVHSEVDPQLFHDIFEVVRYYTKNAELVDLHDDYSDCKCFLTEDGTAGFAVEPNGNLVSVFNLGTTKGFLSAVKDLVREAGATHLDAYASSKQNLEQMYEKTLGFHTASTMDYNMEYDHDDIAKNHGNPQVVFMVDHEVAEPKHFDKDSYDAAQQYQLLQLHTTKGELEPPTFNENTSQKVPLKGYEYFNDLYEDTTVDAEWKIPYLQELDHKLSLGNSSEENQNILNQMDTILNSTSEAEFLEGRNTPQKKETEKSLTLYDRFNQQLNNLLNFTGYNEVEEGFAKMSAQEIRHTADLIVNSISDEITKIQNEKGYAEKEYPTVKTSIDFSKASRREIVDAISISNLINKAKERFEQFAAHEDNLITSVQADLLTDNWDAVISLAADSFVFNEGFGIAIDYVKGNFRTTDKSKVDIDNFQDYSNDDDIAEEEGPKDEQEKWQVDIRTIDVLNSMSALVRQGLHNCYLLDAENNPVMSKWNIPERVDPRKATNSILRWTQGSKSLADMINKLSEKQTSNPWLSQLIERLSDTSGNETDFQSQFYGVFSKAFQRYSIVLLDDGKYYSKMVNDHPALSDVMKSISARLFSATHPLFGENNIINAKLLGNSETIGKDSDFNLHKALVALQGVDDTIVKEKKDIDNDMAKIVTDNVIAACKVLGFTEANESLISDAINKENIHTWANKLFYIVRELDTAYTKQTEGKLKDYKPLGYKEQHTIGGTLRAFLAPTVEKLEDLTVSAFYDSGKMYQSYITPSFMTKLFDKFHEKDLKRFNNFMEKEYGRSEWFTFNKLGRRVWRNEWLRLLSTDKDAREIFEHKVELNFNKHNYMRNMNDAEYTISLITEYFSESTSNEDSNRTPAWFRVPMQSNKPSSDFIRFYSYRGNSYKGSIVNGLYNMFLQELSRIQTVNMRNLSKKDDGFIKNFDSNGKKFCFLPVLNAFLENTSEAKDRRNLTVEYDEDRLSELQQKYDIWENAFNKEKGETTGDVDLESKKTDSDKLKKLELSSEESWELFKLQQKNAANSNALSYEENNLLAELLQKKVKGEAALNADEEMELAKLVKRLLHQFMELRVQSILDNWEKSGILDAVKNVKNIYPASLNDDNHPELASKHVRNQVENFLWNDAFASKNILQLTIGDIAFYKDTEDLQKRLAQLHAPGVRANVNATDYNGNFVSDGYYRTFILKDFDSFISNIIANISEVFDRKIAAAPKHEKAAMIALKESLVGKDGKYRKINVTDAQGYSSPSSYRKKSFLFGRWSRQAEDIYQKLKDNPSLTDLEVAFQPLKPFVYSKLTKNMGVENAPIHTMYVPFQAKNAEYLLIMADALLQGEKTSRPNLLRAVYRIMEDSEKLMPTKGIDTVQFESSIKSGLQAPMDIHQFIDMEGGEDVAYEYMKERIFNREFDKQGNRMYQSYNTDIYVHETSYDDYCMQQEVPEHFKQHSQAHGSQVRMITPSDLDYFTTDENGNQVDNYYTWTEPDETVKRMKADEFRKEYENTIAENIKESISALEKELHLDSTDIKERNIALSNILQREISSSPRYGIDLMQACQVDSNGEFRIPKGDPIQAKRIEQLINSIIKNRVNKQKIAGGPIVQVSNFGTSRQLHIRFNDKQGNLMPLESEYNPSEHDNLSYADYCRKYQGGIAYFEVFAPIWDDDIQRKFKNPDGSINMEDIEAMDPEMLKMVSYRIPTEDKYSCAPMKVVGFMPRIAGDAIMLPYELTEIDDSDFDVDKRYVMRKDNGPILERLPSQVERLMVEKLVNDYKLKHSGSSKEEWIKEKVHALIYNPKSFKVEETKLMQALQKVRQSVTYYTKPPKSGKAYRDNKIVDMTMAVLTNERTADKILNPGGFDAPKKMGYMVAAYKNPANKGISWDTLQQKSIDELKDLCYTEKDLTFADIQVQFYKQNSAAASLIGVFAVNKVAHAILESNDIYIDVSEICGNTPFTVAGMTFGDRMQIDMKYDNTGNLIGKTLGSLVSASADAVKDPILNLMNINMLTAGMLNSMLRLGMPFDDAALFLSQDIIGRMLNQFNRENLSNSVSMDSLIDKWLNAYRKKNNISSASKINTEALSKEELVEGLTSNEHEVIDYKVLLAFQKFKALADNMRNPTFATRFNSISSAVGPLIIDNLITKHKIEKFKDDNNEEGTHFYTKDGVHVDIDDVFFDHPVLAQFKRGLDIADKVFHDMPAGSTGFSGVLDFLSNTKKYGNLGDIIYDDKKLLDQLSNFYQSYLLAASGFMNTSELSYYINSFPKDFMREDYRSKYPNNALIQAIRMNVSKKTGHPYLMINITGIDEREKEKLQCAWIDLHKENPELSRKLFNYSFFVAGVGFSPKTFMALVPTYVKERLKNSENDASYIDTYRVFPEVVPSLVIDQFIRNNWDKNKLVPWKGGKDSHYITEIKHKELIVREPEDMKDLAGVPYMKTSYKKNTYMWRLSDIQEDSITYEMVSPLGNNGEYLEMGTHDIRESLSVPTAVSEDNASSDLAETSAEETDSAIPSTSQVPISEQAKNVSEIVRLFMQQNPALDEKAANEMVDKAKGNTKIYKKFLQNVFKHKGLDLDPDEAIEEFKKYC